jgi:Ras-related protein Rab-1A
MSDEVILKFLILGDITVGKTTLLLKYIDNFTPEIYISTLGVDYKTKNIVFNGIKVSLQIWDTAGQERYKVITKSFVKGTDGIIFMYDITQKESFINIKKWIEETEGENPGDVKKIIVGNKIDKEEDRQVTDEMKEKLSKEVDIDLIEVSAKKGIDVDKVFDILVEKILGNMTTEQILKKYGRSWTESSFSSHVPRGKKKCC